MTRLYRAESNAMNFLYLKDDEHDEMMMVFDWDLSEEEIEAIVAKFESGEPIESNYCSTEWIAKEDMSGLFNHELLASK